jgi:hypothetical protein
MAPNIAEMVEVAAKARSEDPAPRDFINEVLDKIDSGEIGLSEDERYPTGAPSLRVVYNLAKKLYQESTSRA